jgi:hypothetical protein
MSSDHLVNFPQISKKNQALANKTQINNKWTPFDWSFKEILTNKSDIKSSEKDVKCLPLNTPEKSSNNKTAIQQEEIKLNNEPKNLEIEQLTQFCSQKSTNSNRSVKVVEAKVAPVNLKSRGAIYFEAQKARRERKIAEAFIEEEAVWIRKNFGDSAVEATSVEQVHNLANASSLSKATLSFSLNNFIVKKTVNKK